MALPGSKWSYHHERWHAAACICELRSWQTRQLAKYFRFFWVTRWVTCWARVAVSGGELGAVKGCLCLQRWPEAARVPGQSSPAQNQDPDPGWSHGCHRPRDRWPHPDDHSDTVCGLHSVDHCTQAEHNHGLHQVKSLSKCMAGSWVYWGCEAALGGVWFVSRCETGSLVQQCVSNRVLIIPEFPALTLPLLA